MFSATSIWADNQVSEWCGELMNSSHETIIALARRFGLPLDDFAGNPSLRDTYKLLGRYYTVEQAYEDWRGVQPALAKDLEAAGESTTYDKFTPEGQKLDRMSVAEWIDSRVAGGRKSSIGALLDVAYAIEYGADTTDQSALNLVYRLSANKQTEAGQGFNVFGASDKRYHIRGGNQQLPKRIAQHLRTPVQLGMRMTSIARNGDGTYALAFDGHPSVTADLVILSVPFAVLRKIDTSGAGFDTRKNTAIQELGRGQSGKLQLQFSSRYWREAGPWPGRGNGLSYTDEGYQNTWEVSRRQSGATGILNNYTGGSTTAAKTTTTPFATAADPNVQHDAKAFLGGLETVFPGGTPKWNARAASSLPRSIPTSARPIPTGAWGNTPQSPATRRCDRAMCSSPASTARSTTKATWRAARPKARGRRRRSWTSFAGRRHRARPRAGRPVWVFLAAGLLAAKAPVLAFGKAWISLDSLVQNEPFQWVTRDFR